MWERDKKQILCVDDSHDNCDLLGFVLSEAGYELQTAQSVATGLQITRRSKFALYIVDLCFPGESGFDFIQEIRTVDQSTPIVVCSADSRLSVQKEAAQLNTQAFLTIPLDADRLIQTIAQLLAEKSTAESLE